MFWIALLGAWLLVSPLLGLVLGSAIAHANKEAAGAPRIHELADAPCRTQPAPQAGLASVG
jgi:hypothetical protein